MSSDDKDQGKDEGRPRQRKITASAVNGPQLRLVHSRPAAAKRAEHSPRKPSR